MRRCVFGHDVTAHDGFERGTIGGGQQQLYAIGAVQIRLVDVVGVDSKELLACLTQVARKGRKHDGERGQALLAVDDRQLADVVALFLQVDERAHEVRTMSARRAHEVAPQFVALRCVP